MSITILSSTILQHDLEGYYDKKNSILFPCRVRQLFSCCPGFEAAVPSGADENATVVVNARRYTVECNSPVPSILAEPEPPEESVPESKPLLN